jgi:hypothetical protein
VTGLGESGNRGMVCVVGCDVESSEGLAMMSLYGSRDAGIAMPF